MKVTTMLRRAARVAHLGKRGTGLNLLGDREIEWSFITAHLPDGSGRALDAGAGASFLGLVAAQRGFEVTAVDLLAVTPPYTHPRLRHVQGDLLAIELETPYDLIINCSTVEHIGLPGRYGVEEAITDGDLALMARLRELLAPQGTMLLTVPVGRDAVFAPNCRVYGAERLPRLLAGFDVELEQFWTKDDLNRWAFCDRHTALAFEGSAETFDPLRNVYALGGFVLRTTAETP